MIQVSIIIVNFNCSQLTIGAVESIVLHTHKVKYEIIIVDNASTLEQKNILNEYFKYFPNVNLIYSDLNLGFGKANNLGTKYANGQMLFFLNPDTILINDAISILYESYLLYNNIGVCGGQLFDMEGKKMHSYSMFLPGVLRDWDTALGNLLSKIKIIGQNKGALKVGYITGADLMINKDLFSKIGGFDSDFFMYYEESEMTYRIKKKGYKIVCFENAKIIHLEGKTHIFNDAKLRMIFNGRRLFLQKTKGRIMRYVTHVSYVLLNNLAILRCKFNNDVENIGRLQNKMKIYKEVFNNKR